MPRHGHISVLYRTYNYEQCAKFVEIDICAEFNNRNATCPICQTTEKNKRDKYALVKDMKERQYWRDPSDPACPPACCPIDESNLRTDCKRAMGSHGYAVQVDQEIMLVFGGLVARDRTFENSEGEEYDIFNYCEDYERISGVKDVPYFLRTCGEELVRDVWLYNVKDNFWTSIKPDYNADLYIYVK